MRAYKEKDLLNLFFSGSLSILQPWDSKSLALVLRYLSGQTEVNISPFITLLAKWKSKHSWTAELSSFVKRIHTDYCTFEHFEYAQQKNLRERVEKLMNALDEDDPRLLELKPCDAWTNTLVDSLNSYDEAKQDAWTQLLAHCERAKSSSPSKTFLKKAQPLVEAIGTTNYIEVTSSVLQSVGAAFGEPPDSNDPWVVDDTTLIDDRYANLLRGLVWTTSLVDDESLLASLAGAADRCFQKVKNVGPRAPKIGNACLWVFAHSKSIEAVSQLNRLLGRVKHASSRKQIEKSLNAAAEYHGLSRSDLEDMAVPTCGLTDVGIRQEQFGEFTAELRIFSSTSTQIVWIAETGKTQKTVPKRVKEEFSAELKTLKAADKLVKQTVSAQRERLEASYCANKQWTFDVWRERLIDHPLMGWIARRLVWTFGEGTSACSAIWQEKGLIDAAGEPIDMPSGDTKVCLWHPIYDDEAAITAWRDWFVKHEMTQPFKQAHREVYLLTDAERNTNSYSNRFAAHMLKQHQFQALCQARSWRYDLMGAWDSHNVPERLLPEHGFRAEFWVESTAEGELSPAGVFLYVATDQVRFYRYDHEAYTRDRWRSGPGQQQNLDQIPPLVLSEIMRDVDLFVGVASVANDPNWQDGGPEGRYRDYWHDTSFGDLGATAQTRREILERLVPKLKIGERCSFDEKFLIVRGDKRTYKIHLGSSNILMEPNDQYLCIVPGRGAGPGDKVFLPFEGDQRLAVILSKAMMLAADTKITDPTILSQIGR